ncbi:LysM peptidoglycan-binding domain-containing protein [Phragmitibacter flavus]|uniref:LysM peptidoglycan-binding domain-containing protein n=1 Tax=Phragmitibacter flavus TaxID=2576071 RepID=A0A5R8K9E7_9BACT|nr:LysM peptidoglycan-binding domain-containing protein [Phragmitibacter flavus]TLD68933.1 LysM peptidoglycan-binding domain-containing protein [Phragmitibacter flavus]
MHSLNIPIYSIAVAFSLAASLPAASSQTKNPVSKTSGPVQHKVAKGETMWSIAQKHQTSVGEIMEHNRLQSHVVREGMNLKIPSREAVKPITSTTSNNTSNTPRPTTRESIHVVKSGETFWTIAEKYKINPQALAQANPNINPNRLHPDMEVTVPPAQIASSAQKTTPQTTAKPTRTNPTPPVVAASGEHILEQGETFYSISKKRGIKLADLVAANPTLKPERLKPGTKINLPGGTANSTKPQPTLTSSQTPKPATTAPKTTTASSKRHTVGEGDSIASIAEKHSISTDLLLKQNRLTESDSIYIGDVLTIPTTASGTTPTQQKTASTTTPTTNTTASNTSKPTTATEAPSPATVETSPVKPKANAPLHVAEDGSIRSYIVSHGETDETICEAFGITKKELFEHNKLSQGTQLRPGDEIMIPATTKKTVVSR